MKMKRVTKNKAQYRTRRMKHKERNMGTGQCKLAPPSLHAKYAPPINQSIYTTKTQTARERDTHTHRGLESGQRMMETQTAMCL